MKDVLYALANLLNEVNERNNMPNQAILLASLQRAVERAPGPRVKRFAHVLETLAVDAVP